MQFKHSYALVAIALGCMLTACHSDIDLTDIDTKADVEMGLAVPVGSIHATLGDFLGYIPNIYVDSVEHIGVITWKDTFSIERNFHKVDLAKYLSNTDMDLKVRNQLDAMGLIGTDGKVTGTGNPVTLRFKVPLRLEGINGTLDNERIDSALIEDASFTSNITPHNLSLEWNWIDRVTLELGPQIERPASNIMTVYRRGDAGGYNTDIPTDVDKFSLCMMKNRNLNPRTDYLLYKDNVVDSCEFYINFTFTIPNGTKVDVPDDASFAYHLGVRFIDYKAVWGFFKQSKDMYDSDTVDLGENWGSVDFLRRAKLPFAEPKIDMRVITQIGGALVMEGDYLFVQDIDGNQTFAEFNGGHARHVYFNPGEYLDPITSQIGDSSTNMAVLFDKDPARGRIDRLFKNIPDKLGYSFNVNFSFQTTPQIRITPNSNIRVNAICYLPMIFKDGLFVDYTDTIKDVNLSQYSIDSLIADVEIIDTLKATDVVLYLKAKNTIPLDVKATMRCLDEADQVIMDPDDPTQPLIIVPGDTLLIPAPDYEKAGGTWRMSKEGENVVMVALTKKKLDMLPRIKSIVYTASIDNASLQEAFNKGMADIRLTEDEGITIKIGVTAHVEALLDFDGKDNQ